MFSRLIKAGSRPIDLFFVPPDNHYASAETARYAATGSAAAAPTAAVWN